jgi:predicted TIM-barrel fold metal-dependent hydrolase
MSRGIVCAALLAIATCAAAGDAPNDLPIIDAHFHVMPYMDLAELQKAMDRNGIRAAGGANAIGGPQRTIEVVNTLGARYIRATGQGQWLSLKQDGGVAALENADGPAFKSRLSSMEADLRDNGARVIGEIHVSSLNSAANERVYHKIRGDAPTLKAMFDLAGKYKRALNVHAEWSGDTARELTALAASNREARLILSHCGVIASASDIRDVFEKNSNILCDLSFRSPPQLKPKIMNRMVFDNGRLRDDWKKLIEDFPDRFIVGIDDVFNWADYEDTVRNIRTGLLANLKPDVAEKVAWKNAQALFGLE